MTVAGHELRVFTDSPKLIAAMCEDIRAARTRVWLEFYIVVDDSAGKEVAAALKERAAAGVDVRLMYDALGSQATPSAFFEDLRSAGVKVVAYHAPWDVLWRHMSPSFFRIMNRRNHRKLLVVDDWAAYFGGMNIVDPPSPGESKTERSPSSAGWRDVHVRLSGPQQAEVADSFERSWRRAHHLRGPRRARSNDRPSTDAESIRLFDCAPSARHSRADRIYRRLIKSAQESIVLSMAYFIPTGGVLRELFRARKRGVRIQTIIPADSDVKVVQWATRHLHSRLLAHGIELYERQNRMLHSKVMIVDGQWTVVGSCNLDPRSLFLNHEHLAVIRSRAFAEHILEICDHDIEHSMPVTFEHCEGRSYWQRWLDRLAYSFRWFL